MAYDFKQTVTQYGQELAKGNFSVAPGGAALENKFVTYRGTVWDTALAPETATHLARRISATSVALFASGIISLTGLLDDDGDPLTVGLYYLSATIPGRVAKAGLVPALLATTPTEGVLLLNCGILDAPNDGGTYCRQGRDWVAVRGIETKEIIESYDAITQVSTEAGRAFVACYYDGGGDRYVVLADGRLGQEIMIADSAQRASTRPISLGGKLSMEVALVANGQVVTMVWIGSRWSVVSFGEPIPPPNALVDQNNITLEDQFGNTLTS